MAKTRLGNATFVEHGYGQVEPNHLSAQRTGQIYAQLPAKADIQLLENGQFVKYNYKDGVVDFAGKGEWMLVLNEVKLYRDHYGYDDFAMKKEDYVARVYSPIDGENPVVGFSRNYAGVVMAHPEDHTGTTTPFEVETFVGPKLMPQGTNMVPRVFKTNVGDIFTTNCVKEATLAVGDELTPGADGYLAKVATGTAEAPAATPDMVWQVVKVYTLADREKAVKIMRIV